MKKFSFFLISILTVFMYGCNKQHEHIAPAVPDADSTGLMTSYGVNMLVSDSGVIKYRLVTERWIARDTLSIFDKGVFFTEFDENFHVKAWAQADTCFRYTEQNLIELRGKVRVRSKDGLIYRSEQLYWDQRKHEFYSHVYSYLQTPERTIEGHYFRSNEQMTKYYISNSKGIFQQADLGGGSNGSNSSNGSGTTAKPDSTVVQPPVRQPAVPYRKR